MNPDTAAPSQLLIEVWSDLVCPFCYIGKRHLEQALKNLGESAAGSIEVDVLYRSFELAPEARSSEVRTLAMLMSKYKLTEPKAQDMLKNVQEMAAQAGLKYRLADTWVTNSFDAHRLLHAALPEGKQGPLLEALFDAYFCQAQALGDPAVLEQIAVGVGMDRSLVREVLQGDLFGPEVRADEQAAHELGVSSVPFFVFNRKVAISGAQPVAVFEQAIRKVLAPVLSQ